MDDSTATATTAAAASAAAAADDDDDGVAIDTGAVTTQTVEQLGVHNGKSAVVHPRQQQQQQQQQQVDDNKYEDDEQRQQQRQQQQQQRVISEQAARIALLEMKLSEKEAQQATLEGQLGVVQALLLLKNVEVHSSSRTSTANSTVHVAPSAESAKGPARTANTTSESSRRLVRESLDAAQAEVESALRAPAAASTFIGQLRRVKLLKHSWRMLREDALRLRLGIPKITTWMTAALLDAVALQTAKQEALEDKLRELAELFDFEER